jgi:D-glycero-alpha-D-manno-heptose 1-phosphate guanylyltransferase
VITEAMIIAGGFGTRLRGAVPDLPKCMAPILAKPFIGYLMDYLQRQGIRRFILCLGYKADVVQQYLNTQYGHLTLVYQIEHEPLGTGGAIRAACSLATEKTVLVLNGDTFFKIDVPELDIFHQQYQGDCTICLKPMKQFERYGVVELNENNSVQSFREKQFYESGLINGGTYALNVPAFLAAALPEKLSFEKDYLETHAQSGKLIGHIQDVYFIDIGVPEDFERAQTELLLNTENYD